MRRPEFSREYPTESVPDHVTLLEILFQTWLHNEGWARFQLWLDETREEE